MQVIDCTEELDRNYAADPASLNDIPGQPSTSSGQGLGRPRPFAQHARPSPAVETARQRHRHSSTGAVMALPLAPRAAGIIQPQTHQQQEQHKWMRRLIGAMHMGAAHGSPAQADDVRPQKEHVPVGKDGDVGNAHGGLFKKQPSKQRQSFNSPSLQHGQLNGFVTYPGLPLLTEAQDHRIVHSLHRQSAPLSHAMPGVGARTGAGTATLQTSDRGQPLAQSQTPFTQAIHALMTSVRPRADGLHPDLHARVPVHCRVPQLKLVNADVDPAWMEGRLDHWVQQQRETALSNRQRSSDDGNAGDVSGSDSSGIGKYIDKGGNGLDGRRNSGKSASQRSSLLVSRRSSGAMTASVSSSSSSLADAGQSQQTATAAQQAEASRRLTAATLCSLLLTPLGSTGQCYGTSAGGDSGQVLTNEDKHSSEISSAGSPRQGPQGSASAAPPGWSSASRSPSPLLNAEEPVGHVGQRAATLQLTAAMQLSAGEACACVPDCSRACMYSKE